MSHHLWFCPVWQLEPSQVCNQQYTMVPAGPHPRGFRGFGRTLPRGQKVRSTERIFFFISVYFLWADHDAITLFLLPECIKLQDLAPFFQNFTRGAYPRTPQEELGLRPSTSWSAWKQKEPTRLDSCVQPWPKQKFCTKMALGSTYS